MLKYLSLLVFLTPTFSQAAEKPVASAVAPVQKPQRITLEFADADVRRIFQLLAEVSGKNFVLGDDVTGIISLKVTDVPWEQALKIILDAKDLTAREEGKVTIIRSKAKTKTPAEEEAEKQAALIKTLPLESADFDINYADLPTISAQLTAIKTDRGRITMDTRTSAIIAKDIAPVIAEMKELVKKLDQPERQVMIEAHIVEANSSFLKSLGVNWGIHVKDPHSTYGINSIDTGFGGLAATVPPTTGVSGASGGSMGISFGSLAGSFALDLRLNAAVSAGQAKIISSPRVATLNNKSAKISQGQQIPYQNTTATTGAVTAFVTASLSLDVTPHINKNGTVSLKIDAKNDAPGIGNPPPINTKQANTELLLKDGETTVIGGIMVDSEADNSDGVPWLMDLPYIGTMFKSSSKTKTKSELLIFITPRILNPEEKKN